MRVLSLWVSRCSGRGGIPNDPRRASQNALAARAQASMRLSSTSGQRDLSTGMAKWLLSYHKENTLQALVFQHPCHYVVSAQPSFITAHIQTCEVLGLKDPAGMADDTSYLCENGSVLAPSNLSHCLEAFENVGYTVTWLVCDPKDHKLPVSRPRIHFQGLDAFKLGGKAAKSHLQALKLSWSRLAADVMTPRSLDCYLLSEEQVKCSQLYENLLSQNQGAKV